MSKNENEKAQIVLDNADKFANELWSKVVDDRLFSYQKNDICDYLLYLFNTHSKDKFLDTNFNEQNERLLKMSATKIKTSKKNIAVKFMSEDEYNEIYAKFLDKIKTDFKNGKILIKDDKFYFTIENTALRDIISAKLKTMDEEVLDFSFNSEKINISFNGFMSLLKVEFTKNDDNRQEFETLVQTFTRKYNFKKGLKTLVCVAGFGANLSGIIDFVSTNLKKGG